MRRSKGRAFQIRTGKLADNLAGRTTVNDRHSTLRARSMASSSFEPPQGHDPDQGDAPRPPLWGLDEPGLKIVDVFICQLRKKLAMATAAITTSRQCRAALTCCVIRTTGSTSRRRKPHDPADKLDCRLKERADSVASPPPREPGVTLLSFALAGATDRMRLTSFCVSALFGSVTVRTPFLNAAELCRLALRRRSECAFRRSRRCSCTCRALLLLLFELLSPLKVRRLSVSVTSTSFSCRPRGSARRRFDRPFR